MFERFDEPARRTLFFSRYEASELGSKAIEPFHVVLGLVRDAKGLTHELLLEASNPLDELVKEIRGHILVGPKIDPSLEIPFSAATKRGLALAVEEADRLSHQGIGTEHLLLGILRGGDSVGAAILHGRGLNLEKARLRIGARGVTGAAD